MWTALWVARVITNVLIAVIPGINENNPVLVVLGFSVPLEFASSTMLACALSFVQLSTVRNWFTEHFLPRGRDEKLMYLYRITLFSYGLRMLAFFLYDSFLVARAITRERQFRELDSILLALDVGYRGSLTVFFFRKFFEFENTPEVFVVTATQWKLNVSQKLRGRSWKLTAKFSEIKGRRTWNQKKKESL